MKTRIRRPQPRSQRRGHILVLCVILSTTMIGLLGFVVDGGLLMNSHRQAQNAADAAAQACAVRIRYERKAQTASYLAAPQAALQTLAQLYALDVAYNNVPPDSSAPATQVVVNYPPTAGPHSGNNRYVEVFVTYPVRTFFIQVLGIAADQTVAARAVAGYDLVPQNGAGLLILDPDGNPGLKVSGGASVTVNADIYVFSLHKGVSANGDTAGIAAGQPAATVNGGAILSCVDPYVVHVSGGVDTLANFSPPNVGTLQAGGLEPDFNDPNFFYDPFFNEGTPLPPPTTANAFGGKTPKNFGSVTINNTGLSPIDSPNKFSKGTGVTTLNPGIYSGISITNGANVEFVEGVYVLRPTASGGGNILSISGDSKAILAKGSKTGIMFYNTGNSYNPDTGQPDLSDLCAATNIPPTSADNFQGISITGGQNVNLAGFTNGTFTFGMLIYQRRANRQSIRINDGFVVGTTGNAQGFAGTVYAKWADLQLAGNGTYNFAIVVGTMSVSGNATVTVPYGFPVLPKANIVYLVE